MISTILIIGFVMFACLKIVNRKVLQAERILIEQYPTWQNFNKKSSLEVLMPIGIERHLKPIGIGVYLKIIYQPNLKY